MKQNSIDEYKPYRGFYDLRDFTLPKKIFGQLWRAQAALYKMSKNKAYLKEWHPGQWAKAKELSADYQSVLLQHVGIINL